MRVKDIEDTEDIADADTYPPPDRDALAARVRKEAGDCPIEWCGRPAGHRPPHRPRASTTPPPVYDTWECIPCDRTGRRAVLAFPGFSSPRCRLCHAEMTRGSPTRGA